MITTRVRTTRVVAPETAQGRDHARNIISGGFPEPVRVDAIVMVNGEVSHQRCQPKVDLGKPRAEGRVYPIGRFALRE